MSKPKHPCAREQEKNSGDDEMWLAEKDGTVFDTRMGWPLWLALWRHADNYDVMTFFRTQEDAEQFIVSHNYSGIYLEILAGNDGEHCDFSMSSLGGIDVWDKLRHDMPIKVRLRLELM